MINPIKVGIMIQQILLWCGNIVLLNTLINNCCTDTVIKVRTETVDNKNYTYEVSFNDCVYYYRFTLSSNTKLQGYFFIESDTWRSPVYSIENQYNFYRISKTSINYFDVYFYNKNNIMIFDVNRGMKTSIITISCTIKNTVYNLKYVQMPIDKNQVYTASTIRNLFCMTGAIDQIKVSAADVFAYNSKNDMLVSYLDSPIQIVGLEQLSHRGKSSELQVINSFFSQKYEFKEYANGWHISETFSDNCRKYDLEVEDNKIIIPDKSLTYIYQEDNRDIMFRKKQ